MESPALAGVPASHLLDALVFSSPESAFKQVFVDGTPVLAGDAWPELSHGMREAMHALWA
jgi:formimidoylglutamate deiminase